MIALYIKDSSRDVTLQVRKVEQEQQQHRQLQVSRLFRYAWTCYLPACLPQRHQEAVLWAARARMALPDAADMWPGFSGLTACMHV